VRLPGDAPAQKDFLFAFASIIREAGCAEAQVVAAEITRKSCREPVTAAVRKIVAFVNIIAAAIKKHSDASVGYTTGTRADTLRDTDVPGRITVRIGPFAACVVMILAGYVIQHAEPQWSAETLRKQGGVIRIVP